MQVRSGRRLSGRARRWVFVRIRCGGSMQRRVMSAILAGFTPSVASCNPPWSEGSGRVAVRSWGVGGLRRVGAPSASSLVHGALRPDLPEGACATVGEKARAAPVAPDILAHWGGSGASGVSVAGRRSGGVRASASHPPHPSPWGGGVGTQRHYRATRRCHRKNTVWNGWGPNMD